MTFTQYKLPEDVKERWITDLESGEYAQGRSYLSASDRPGGEGGTRRYCCLGVLCELLKDELRLPVMPADDDDREPGMTLYPFSYGGESSVLPRKVQDRIGLPLVTSATAALGDLVVGITDEDYAWVRASANSSSSLDVHRGFNGPDIPAGAVTLTQLNDAGVPFSVIAHVIRRYL